MSRIPSWSQSHLTGITCCCTQGSKLTLANAQNASDFENLWARNTHWWTFESNNHSFLPNIWKEFASGLTSLLAEKISLAKLCKPIKKLTLSPCCTCTNDKPTVNAVSQYYPIVILSKRVCRCPAYLDASIVVPDSNSRQSTGFRAARFNTREVKHQFNWMLVLEATWPHVTTLGCLLIQSNINTYRSSWC